MNSNADKCLGVLGEIGRSVGQVVGILNVTPDSFSDGGVFMDVDSAVNHAREMERDGAAVIDIGGVSTRPGAEEVDEEAELQRVVPVVQAVVESVKIPVSVDTWRARVFEACHRVGASILNDVTALRGDPAIIDLMMDLPEVPVILMHMEGEPTERREPVDYDDIAQRVRSFFEERLQTLASAGLSPERMVLDPGFGFDKDTKQNLELLTRLDEVRVGDRPLFVGVSRKRFLGAILDEVEPTQRDWGTAAVSAYLLKKNIEFVRVHNVKATVDVRKTFEALQPGCDRHEEATA